MPWMMLPSMRVLQAVRIDDLAAVVRDRELARPDLAGAAVDVDLGDDRAGGAVALRIGDAAAGDRVAGLVLARRGPRVPAGLLGRRLDHRDVARVLDVPQPELDRIDAERRRDLVHERFAGEVDLRPDRIAQMRRAQRRGALEQRRDRLPRGALVGELVGFRRHAESVADLQRERRGTGRRACRSACCRWSARRCARSPC